MTVLTPSRPDLAAHREATATAFPKLVRDLTGIIGRKLTAYIAGVKDVRALDRWIEGAEPYKNSEERLRFAFRVVRDAGESRSPIRRSSVADWSQSRTQRSRADPPAPGGRSREGRP